MISQLSTTTEILSSDICHLVQLSPSLLVSFIFFIHQHFVSVLASPNLYHKGTKTKVASILSPNRGPEGLGWFEIFFLLKKNQRIRRSSLQMRGIILHQKTDPP